MAYKTFANGFPLPASDLNNFLMNQSVIVFADAAARTTAIPTPIQGMLTYLVDTAAYESWNGSAFVSISNPGDITAVTAGTGLTGGGTSGDVTLNLDSAAVIPSSTVTTAQDLIVADGASSVTRLGVGTDDQVLSVVAGAVAWADAGGGGGMELISTTTLSGASVTLSSIPGTYKDLKVLVRNFRPVGNGRSLVLQFNADTSNHAQFTALESNGFSMNGNSCTIDPYQTSGSSTGVYVISINDYASTVNLKAIETIGLTNESSTYRFQKQFAAYGVDAISSIKVSADNGDLTSGNVLLYGVN